MPCVLFVDGLVSREEEEELILEEWGGSKNISIAMMCEGFIDNQQVVESR